MATSNRYEKPGDRKFRDRATPGKKISLGEVSRRTGLSMAHVSKIFNGQRLPSLPAAALIATAKGISLDEFYMMLVDLRKGAITTSTRKRVSATA